MCPVAHLCSIPPVERHPLTLIGFDKRTLGCSHKIVGVLIVTIHPPKSAHLSLSLEEVAGGLH